MRTAGLLLHPTALPGRYGVGDLGPAALEFVDFLGDAGMGMWQVLPLGPPATGASPYTCFSAFAGNPLLVSPEVLRDEGLLSQAQLDACPELPAQQVDFIAAGEARRKLLEAAFAAFEADAGEAQRTDLADFAAAHASWLPDFELFMAVKESHGGSTWTAWERGLANRSPRELARWRESLAPRLRFHRFVQFAFFRQWEALRKRCAERRVKIMGDIPIFVAHDSADVWGHPELFDLDMDGSPAVVAGVPPDYFSDDGQLWGNPLYRWDIHARTGFRWWVDRVRGALSLVDVLRIDHFRGFESYWEVPADAETAKSGRWVPGPRDALFTALREALGELPLVAEDLGIITPEVEALRDRFGLPGMAILLFAFTRDGFAYRPHLLRSHVVVYTGTHDNDTVVGWWNATPDSAPGLTETEFAAERAMARRYFDTDGHDIHWRFVRAALGSVAETAIVPVQDVLGLGSEARFNRPGVAEGHWTWRLPEGALTPDLAVRLRELVEIYDRL